MRVQISLQDTHFISSEYVPKSGIVGSYGSSFLFFFLRNIHNVFHNSCPSLYTYQQCTMYLFSPHPSQHLFLVFSVIIILTDVRWYFIVVLTCISLMISKFRRLFIYLFAICTFSFEKCLFRSFTHFSTGLFVFWLLSCMSSSYILILTPYQILCLQIFSPIP